MWFPDERVLDLDDGASVLPVGERSIALVDPADAARLKHIPWRLDSMGYAVYGSGARLRMHREVRGEPPSPAFVLDHANGCLLDNRRGNLRWATVAQNNRNSGKRTSGPYKGVQPDPRGKSWCARITIGGTVYHVASAPTADQAARAYDVTARIAFGDYARTNQDLGLLPPCEPSERLPHLDSVLNRDRLLGAIARDRANYRAQMEAATRPRSRNRLAEMMRQCSPCVYTTHTNC